MGLNKDTLGTIDKDITNLTIFPNPASHLIEVSISENIEKIVLVDMLGQELLRRQPNHANASVDLYLLAPGTYIIFIRSNGQEISRQFIKQ
ncbi:MAG: hypothetical protein ACI849_001428 [Patiriisocius sp.]